MTTTPLPHMEAVERLVDSLDERLDEIVELMVESYAEHIPSYRDAPPEVAEDIREGARASLVVGAAILRGATTGAAVRDPLRDLGRRRAQQGLPLPDVINAFMVGTRTFWTEIVNAAPEDPQERADVLSHVMSSTLDLLQNATATVSAGWREIDELRIVDEEHDYRTVVEMMAGIRPADTEHMHRAARRGIDLDRTAWCLVTNQQDTAAEVVRDLRRQFPDSPIAPSGELLIAFLPDDAPPKPIEGCRCGLATAADPSIAFKRARSAHKVALHLDRSTVVYDEVVPLALVLDASPEERSAFVEAQLGPVLTDPLGAELLTSLESFYASGQSVAAAARHLHVHRHTLEYRLGRLETLLKTDLRASGPRLLLELALSLRDES